jgi:hypothetical protein
VTERRFSSGKIRCLVYFRDLQVDELFLGDCEVLVEVVEPMRFFGREGRIVRQYVSSERCAEQRGHHCCPIRCSGGGGWGSSAASCFSGRVS